MYSDGKLSVWWIRITKPHCMVKINVGIFGSYFAKTENGAFILHQCYIVYLKLYISENYYYSKANTWSQK